MQLEMPENGLIDERYVVVFVLGGPGAGKGTQCQMLAKRFNFVHLSAGDLLREERERPGSAYGELINEYIREGQIVPQHITIELLRNAMVASGKHRFLIDGFPRHIEQGEEFERLVCPSTAMLFFECDEEVMLTRLTKRGETSQRTDDNMASIMKRLDTFRSQTLPVKEWAQAAATLHVVPCADGVADVFERASKTLQEIIDGLPASGAGYALVPMNNGIN